MGQGILCFAARSFPGLKGLGVQRAPSFHQDRRGTERVSGLPRATQRLRADVRPRPRPRHSLALGAASFGLFRRRHQAPHPRGEEKPAAGVMGPDSRPCPARGGPRCTCVRRCGRRAHVQGKRSGAGARGRAPRLCASLRPRPSYSGPVPQRALRRRTARRAHSRTGQAGDAGGAASGAGRLAPASRRPNTARGLLSTEQWRRHREGQRGKGDRGSRLRRLVTPRRSSSTQGAGGRKRRRDADTAPGRRPDATGRGQGVTGAKGRARGDGAWRGAGRGAHARGGLRGRQAVWRRRGLSGSRSCGGNVWLRPGPPGLGVQFREWGHLPSVRRDEDVGRADRGGCREDSGGGGVSGEQGPARGEAPQGARRKHELPGETPCSTPSRGPGRGCTGPGPSCQLLLATSSGD